MRLTAAIAVNRIATSGLATLSESSNLVKRKWTPPIVNSASIVAVGRYAGVPGRFVLRTGHAVEQTHFSVRRDEGGRQQFQRRYWGQEGRCEYRREISRARLLILANRARPSGIKLIVEHGDCERQQFPTLKRRRPPIVSLVRPVRSASVEILLRSGQHQHGILTSDAREPVDRARAR